MCKDTSRNMRRHHRARLINKYMNYEIIRWHDSIIDTVENRRKKAILNVHNIKKCSCFMCGNQRHNKWFKKERLTIQERKTLMNHKEQMNIYNNE